MERGADSTGRDANLSWTGVFFPFFFSPLEKEDGIISVITDYGQLVTSSQSLLSPLSGITCNQNKWLRYYRLNAGLCLKDAVLTQQKRHCAFQQHQFTGLLPSVLSPVALSPIITPLCVVTQRRDAALADSGSLGQKAESKHSQAAFRLRQTEQFFVCWFC